MLLEDAFVVRDRASVVELFEDGAVLGTVRCEARGGEQIARLATAMWERGHGYLADPLRVIQARATALVVAHNAVNVVRRRSDGRWRYAISLLDIDTTGREGS